MTGQLVPGVTAPFFSHHRIARFAFRELRQERHAACRSNSPHSIKFMEQNTSSEVVHCPRETVWILQVYKSEQVLSFRKLARRVARPVDT